MSMQRVLEIARKLGFPVILTDPAGREPYVILPLEKFESILERSEIDELEISEPLVGAQFPYQSQEVPEMREDLAKNSIADLPIEDRFYLEPLEEELR